MAGRMKRDACLYRGLIHKNQSFRKEVIIVGFYGLGSFYSIILLLDGDEYSMACLQNAPHLLSETDSQQTMNWGKLR